MSHAAEGHRCPEVRGSGQNEKGQPQDTMMMMKGTMD